MAAKPIERYVRRVLKERGGDDYIVETIASGTSVADIARSILRPDTKQPISRAFLSRVIHSTPELSQRVFQAHKESAGALVDQALDIVDNAPLDRDGIQKARVQSETRLRVAGLKDRENWGERKADVLVQLNVGEMHLNALRHRESVNVLGSSAEQVDCVASDTCGTDTHGDSKALPAPEGNVKDTVTSPTAAQNTSLSDEPECG